MTPTGIDPAFFGVIKNGTAFFTFSNGKSLSKTTMCHVSTDKFIVPSALQYIL
jgi:hypothetical protein